MRASRTQLTGLVSLLMLGVGCAGPGLDPGGPSFAKTPAGPKVTSTDPSSSVRDTTLDVRVLGSGFDNGSRADFLLAGAADPKVVTNSTRFVSSGEVVANITIAADAVPDYRDVQVTTATGKKGIGTQKFEVIEPIVIQIPGATTGMARDVNSSGQVVGHYLVSGASCLNRAYVWTEAEGVTTLPMPAGYCQARADAINEAGIIAGMIFPTGGATGSSGIPARWIPTGTGAWEAEVLPKSGSTSILIEVFRINDAGSFIAYWSNPDGTRDAGVWQSGTGWTLLARPAGAPACTPWSLNNNGEVAGFCNIGPGSAVHWASPSSPPMLLPAPSGGAAIIGRGINNLGVTVGDISVSVRNSTTSYLARWTPNGSGGWFAENLGIVGGGRDINDAGVIVGTAFGAWFPGSGVSPLGLLKRGQTSHVTAISNRGASGTTWITGYSATSASSGNFPLVWKR